MCMHSNNVSHVNAEHNNSPLVVSPRTRGGTCAAGVPAQFIIYMLPLSADRDLEKWMRGQRVIRQRNKRKRVTKDGNEMEVKRGEVKKCERKKDYRK